MPRCADSASTLASASLQASSHAAACWASVREASAVLQASARGASSGRHFMHGRKAAASACAAVNEGISAQPISTRRVAASAPANMAVTK